MKKYTKNRLITLKLGRLCIINNINNNVNNNNNHSII